MPLLVETFSLSKRYRKVTALDDCTLGVSRGEVFGLLGPNGAGKTTLLRLLLGYLRPTAGRAVVDGLDTYRQSIHVRRRVAYLPGEVRLFRNLRRSGRMAISSDAGGWQSVWNSTFPDASHSCRPECARSSP